MVCLYDTTLTAGQRLYDITVDVSVRSDTCCDGGPTIAGGGGRLACRRCSYGGRRWPPTALPPCEWPAWCAVSAPVARWWYRPSWCTDGVCSWLTASRFISACVKNLVVVARRSNVLGCRTRLRVPLLRAPQQRPRVVGGPGPVWLLLMTGSSYQSWSMASLPTQWDVSQSGAVGIHG